MLPECAKSQSASQNDEPSQTGASQSPRVFDQEGMQQRLGGNPAMISSMVKTFLQHIPDSIEALKACVASSDAPGVFLRAHSIKGASAYVGGEILHGVATAIEQAAKASDLNTASGQMPALEAAFKVLKFELERLQQAGTGLHR